MLKELKLIDKELSHNQLIRIQDTTSKQDNSLFRALAVSVYYSHSYAAQVKMDLRLALAGNLAERKSCAYPPLN